MLRSTITAALRQFRRAPFHTFSNITGLAVGMAICALIALYIADELGFDRNHENGDRIVRIIEERTADDGSRRQAATPPRLATALLEDVPAVEQTTRFYALGEVRLSVGEAEITAPMMVLADSTVFDVFTLPLVAGNPMTALTAPNSLVLTESMAATLFGDIDPVGRELELDGNQTFTVTGVMADQPRRSHLDMRVLGSFQTMYQYESAERLSNWIWQQFFTYALLDESVAIGDLQRALDAIETSRADPATAGWGFNHEFIAQPLSDIYLKSGNLFFDIGPRGSMDRVILFGAIGLLILAIACFNFMNLSTARSTIRAREVGLRKVVGAHRAQLVRQFLGESTLLALAGLLLAGALVAVASGFYESFTGKPFVSSGTEVGLLAAGAVCIVLLVGVLAGLYPAMYLSAFRPAVVLRGGPEGPAGGALLRRVLVVAQFAIAVGLVAGTGIVQKQLEFIRERDPGFDKELLVTIPAAGSIDDRAQVFIDELTSDPAILSATASYGAPSTFVAGDGIRLPEREDRWGIKMLLVDAHFIDVYDMQIVAGRAFDAALATDVHEAFILNETAAREIATSPEQAIGRQVSWERWDDRTMKEGRVIGVVQDFNYESIHSPVSPMVLHMGPEFVTTITARIAPGRIDGALAAITAAWPNYAADQPVEVDFVDDVLAAEYEAERRLATLNGIFSVLAVFVACLGLFALAAYVVERRAREIGIRKVLGASPFSVGRLVTGQFLGLVAVAFVVGAPVSWLLGRRWLAGFSHHVEIGPVFFLWVGLITAMIAVLAVGGQAWRAARLDPVDNLR